MFPSLGAYLVQLASAEFGREQMSNSRVFWARVLGEIVIWKSRLLEGGTDYICVVKGVSLYG